MLFNFQKIKPKKPIGRIVKPLLSAIIVILLSYWAIRPLFIPGFFPTHDDTAPSRIYEMSKSLFYGQFPVRWVADLGYGFGYPLFNFYAPLPYYLGGMLNMAGLSPILSAKIMFAIGILISGICMYFFVREFSGEMAAITAAIIYLYVPYHAVNIYVRGAVGEYYAYGFIPLLLLGIYKLAVKKQLKKGILIGSLGLSGILLSHNILGLITGYFLLISLFGYSLYILFAKKSFQILYFIFIMVIIGFGLSAFFTLPAIQEKKYTRVEELITNDSDFRNHFVYPRQLWDSPWGYAGSTKGEEDGMSFKIGKMHLILGFIGFILYIYYSKYKKRISIFFYFLTVIFLLSIFLTFEQSLSIWKILPGFPYIQYPWRFLNFSVLCLAVFASFIFFPVKKIWQFIVSVMMIIIMLWFNIKYFSPSEYLPLKDEDYTSNFNLRYKISKISDEYLPNNFIPVLSPQEIAEESLSTIPNVITKKINDEPDFKKYDIRVADSTVFLTNIAFFPGWRAFIDNSEIEIKNNNGRIVIALPKGQYQLTFVFCDTLIRTVANTISVLSVFLLVYVSLFWKSSEYEKRKSC